MPATEWSAAPDSPMLAGEQIHVWRINIAPSPSLIQAKLRSHLTASEGERADRFLADKHRGRFISGRARLRQILGRYCDTAPQDVELQFENLGKPFFADPELNDRIQFNFSNSADLAICAVTLAQPIGVDLERIRPMTDMLGLARRYFADTETDRLFARPVASQPGAFFRLWTRKEAWLKAIGKGLTFPLRDVEVSFDDEACCIQSINQSVESAASWSLIPFFPADDHVGAIAIERAENQPVYYDFA